MQALGQRVDSMAAGHDVVDDGDALSGKIRRGVKGIAHIAATFA